METVDVTNRLIELRNRATSGFYFISEANRKSVMDAIVDAYTLGVEDCSDMLKRSFRSPRSK